jgi:hypothetical protein
VASAKLFDSLKYPIVPSGVNINCRHRRAAKTSKPANNLRSLSVSINQSAAIRRINGVCARIVHKLPVIEY